MLIKRREINPIDKKVVDNIRGLSIDMINEARSGHPGIALGASPILYTLYAYHLRFDVNNPKWINRDRFVLSGGHGSSMLYSTLYMAGFDITLDDLKEFRQLSSKTPGHPELNITPGVDISTGPLGQGIANAVGMAIASRYLKKITSQELIDYNVYALCGDGDLMEGISYEACSLAGRLKLNNLILLYDSNNITLDGNLSNTFNENIKQRFESMNWNYILVSDGEDINLISDSIKEAKNSELPTIIEIKTTIGKYSKYEGTNIVHGKPLDIDDLTSIKEKLELRDIPYQISDEAINYFRETIKNRNEEYISSWMEKNIDLNDDNREMINLISENKLPIKLKDLYYEIPEDKCESPRDTSGKILNSISESNKLIIGGSCDLSLSTKVSFDEQKNIIFGVREFATAAIANGIATCGITPIVSTFLSFSDYMKPAIRMSALMDLPVIYVFTHDSISVGEDGPTHQPVEQLIGLRSVPNLDVYRPADANEVIGAYTSIFERRKPSALILSKNKLRIQENTRANEVNKGAYIVRNENNRLDGIIISTGEELNVSIEVCEKLQEKGLDFRVISMPSIELFDELDDNTKLELIPFTNNIFVIEASSSYSWDRFVKNREHLFTIDSFGKSGKKDDVLKLYNYESTYIENKIEELIK